MDLFKQKTKRRTITLTAYTEFGWRITAARKKTGFSQADLAKKVGKSRSVVAMWETGRALPRLPEFAVMCRALRTTPNKLLGF